jgi:hypothetical protein
MASQFVQPLASWGGCHNVCSYQEKALCLANQVPSHRILVRTLEQGTQDPFKSPFNVAPQVRICR